MIRYRSTGRVMRVSREAFAREYAAAGWDLAPDVPTQDQPQATDEQVESVDPPAKKPRSRSRAKTAG